MNELFGIVKDNWPDFALALGACAFFAIIFKEYRHLLSKNKELQEEQRVELKITRDEQKLMRDEMKTMREEISIMRDEINSMRGEQATMREDSEDLNKQIKAQSELIFQWEESNFNMKESHSEIYEKLDNCGSAIDVLVGLLIEASEEGKIDEGLTKTLQEKLEARGLEVENIKDAIKKLQRKEN